MDDADLIDTASTNIPASSSSALAVIDSIASNCDGAIVYNGTGAHFVIYEGTSKRAVVPPGWSDYIGMPLTIGNALNLKASLDAAIAEGEFSIQLVNR